MWIFWLFLPIKWLGPYRHRRVIWQRKPCSIICHLPGRWGYDQKGSHLHSFVTNDLPHKFEAGTPAIAEAIGFGAAVDYLTAVGMQNIASHEHELIQYALESLSEVEGVKILGHSAMYKGGVASFTMKNIHPHDVSQILRFRHCRASRPSLRHAATKNSTYRLPHVPAFIFTIRPMKLIKLVRSTSKGKKDIQRVIIQRDE